MTFFKPTVLALGISMAALQTASAGPIVHALHCTSVDSGPDHGLTVTINTDLGLKNTYATLSSQSIAGPRPIATYSWLKVADHRPVDGALIYTGRGFKISLPITHPPVRPVATLFARTEGSNSHVIRAKMYCSFPR